MQTRMLKVLHTTFIIQIEYTNCIRLLLTKLHYMIKITS